MTNAAETKAREFASWRSVTPGWRKHDKRLSESFDAVSQALLDLAGVKEGYHVLDVACGTGEPAIPAALRVGPKGKVTATDFVSEMIEFAKEKARRRNVTNIEFSVVDGEQLAVSANTCDAATMRWGLMFMPEPVACLSRIRQALKPGAKFATACWAGPEENPWASMPLGVLKQYMEIPVPQPGQTGIFAFADPERIKAVMAESGFGNIAVKALDVSWSGPATGAEFFQEVIELAGPLASLYAKLSAQDQASFAREVAQKAEQLSLSKTGITFSGRTWVAVGSR